MFVKKYVLMDEEPIETGGGEPQAEESGKWYDSLPEDMREDKNITKFDSVESLGKSWLSAQRLIGADKIPVPQTDEDWGNVYNRLGRPEEPTGYDIKAPEGAAIDENMQSEFLNTAHSLGLSQKQVEGLAAWEFQRGSAMAESSSQASEQAFNEAMEGLKSEWGGAFEQNANIAVRAASEFMSESDKEFLNTAQINGVALGDHPAFLKMFNNIGKQMMEGKTLEGVGSEMVKTPQEIEDERNSLMAHPAYLDKNHPEHNAIVRKVRESFELQYNS